MFRQRFETFAIVIALSSVFADVSIPPKVNLPHGGVLVGSYLRTVNGKTIQGFQGIPYAEPPIGILRFSAPVPAHPWNGEKIVNRDAEMCPQQNSFPRNYTPIGNEDCLYLNVYTPETKLIQEPLSVMVYIHGGGWKLGDGSSKMKGPGKILQNENIILVTMNYRLGALGFLSTGTIDCLGNNGLKDQVLALKWVQENIGAFGGNTNDVTIFGESAGGASVTYHMISPLSKGLFHKAIIQSGTNFDAWAVVEGAVASARAIKLSRLLNCTTAEGRWKEMIECLRTKSAVDIASKTPDFFEFDTDPTIQFPPIVEPDIEGAFLIKLPRNITVPHSVSIPIIIGVTAEEGVLKSGPLLHNLHDEFKSKFYDVLPLLLFCDNKPEDIRKKVTSKVDEFYFQGKHDWTKVNHQNLTNLFSDRWFYSGMDDYLRNRFATKNVSIGETFVYLFDHKGPKSVSEFFNAGSEYYGVCHTDELPYLFPYWDDENTGEDNDAKMKWAFPNMWLNFAKTGNPTPEGSTITKWKPASKFPLEYAHIGSKNAEDWAILKNEVGLAEDRMQFWRELDADLRINEIK